MRAAHDILAPKEVFIRYFVLPFKALLRAIGRSQRWTDNTTTQHLDVLGTFSKHLTRAQLDVESTDRNVGLLCSILILIRVFLQHRSPYPEKCVSGRHEEREQD